MITSVLYVILAILGLSFLIFIHELGHYYMARRLGMRVEVFSIGFGKPIYSWMRDGVRWQIGWLLFGGYVKIAGMEPGEATEPEAVSDGFFGKSPWDRIKVAFMGPFVNILFAIFIFALLWVLGGREKNFSEYTHKIGWVDPKSELYADGIRPGDEIISYNANDYEGSKDHLYGPMTSSGDVLVTGNKVDFYTKQKTPFTYSVKPYSHPAASDKDLLTAGILQPASYIIYDRLPGGKENPLPEGSPMAISGIQYGDRLVWMDGEPLYSLQQLNHLLNDNRVLLTIKRGNDILLRRAPRVRIEELKLDNEIKEELTDWQFEAQLNNKKFAKLYALPYNLDNNGLVTDKIKFIDRDNEEEAFPSKIASQVEAPLEAGDRILAVNGFPVTHSYEILSQLQIKHVNIIVQREASLEQVPSWKTADIDFDGQFRPQDLHRITSEIGINKESITSSGNLYLLQTVAPKPRTEFKLSPESQALMLTERQALKKEIEKIEDPEKRAQAMALYDKSDTQLMIGLPLQDERVSFNPGPFSLFGYVFDDIWRTLTALFTGSLNPKWMSGPVGIVQAAYDSTMVGIKEALYLLGVISLNLGILNLLPLPVLDGGTICFSLYELVTGSRLKPKTLEKLVIPFAIILIGFFIFLTYNDVSRLFRNFFH